MKTKEEIINDLIEFYFNRNESIEETLEILKEIQGEIEGLMALCRDDLEWSKNERY